MITENTSTLKIHKLTKEQYVRELEAGNIDETALYLTPDETADLTIYASKEEVEAVDVKVEANAENITELQSSVAALESYTTTNDSNITTMQSDIAQNKTDISSNATAISELNNTLDSKASSSHTHSYTSLTDKPTIPVAVAVKGNAESSYRTGNVNITPANIGLGNVNNTADSAKSVNYATSAGSANAVAWNNVTGKPSTYTPASHTHSYLPLSGGTVTGNLGVNGTIMANGNNIEGSGTLCIRSASSPVNTATGYGLVVTNYDATSFKQVEASAFTIQSSKKTKENIKNITDEEANKLLEVKTVSFDYKENFGGYKNQFGVIAEQVIDILPSVVSVPDNYNEDDFDESKGINQPILSVDYSKFVPFLIKMIQIQQIKINELEERLNNLS